MQATRGWAGQEVGSDQGAAMCAYAVIESRAARLSDGLRAIEVTSWKPP